MTAAMSRKPPAIRDSPIDIPRVPAIFRWLAERTERSRLVGPSGGGLVALVGVLPFQATAVADGWAGTLTGGGQAAPTMTQFAVTWGVYLGSLSVFAFCYLRFAVFVERVRRAEPRPRAKPSPIEELADRMLAEVRTHPSRLRRFRSRHIEPRLVKLGRRADRLGVPAAGEADFFGAQILIAPVLGMAAAPSLFMFSRLPGTGSVLLLLICLIATSVLYIVVLLVQPAVTKARLADGRCPECGYDIADADERCPECGRPNGLPPLDPRVFRSVADAERILGVRLRPDPTEQLLAELRESGELPDPPDTTKHKPTRPHEQAQSHPEPDRPVRGNENAAPEPGSGHRERL